MALYRFTAEVRGETRSCVFSYSDDWGIPDEEEAELVIMNDSDAYHEFYRGAEYEDYDAELENVKLERVEDLDS